MGNGQYRPILQGLQTVNTFPVRNGLAVPFRSTNMHDFTRGAQMLRPLTVLSNDELRHRAPSAFADHAHESRSSRYAYIPTVAVIDALRAEGFHPVKAMQSRSRMGRTDYTKHMLTFARIDDTVRGICVGDSIPQVNLVNSHDGTSAYNLIAGLFRLACNNGLMVAESFAQSIKVQHTGDIIDRVIEGSFTVIDDAVKAGNVSQEWGRIELAPREQLLLATAAANFRWGNDEGKALPILPERLLQAHRAADDKPDLWSTFNRVQENIVGGGQRARAANGRRMTVRPVAAIDGNVKLNRALWSLAEEMAKLKEAA
jgi:hypothetical protein